MKKYISLLFVFTLLISLGCLCFADNELEGDSSIVIISPSSDEPETPEVSPSTEPTSEPTGEPQPSPSPTATPVLYPSITKDPTNESVFTGDRAVFVARADNAKTITWYLVSPDGASTILASSVPQVFPGINVYGTDGEKLVLENVNTKISGYKAYARFGNENGFTDSAIATVTVSPAPAPSPTPTASPRVTSSPVPTSIPVPTSTPVPVSTLAPISTPSVTPRPSSSTDNETRSGLRIGFGTVLLLILCLAVIAGAAVVLSMYVKGTIDLSWLEALFTKEGRKPDEGKSHTSHREDPDVDVPDNFYDPDDYKK